MPEALRGRDCEDALDSEYEKRAEYVVVCFDEGFEKKDTVGSEGRVGRCGS